MIEINLLPGAARKKKASSVRVSIDFAAVFANMATKFGSPYVLGGAALAVLTLVAVGFMFFKQSRDRTTAEERLATATSDSTRYASVLAQRATLEAKRDTVLRQVNLIRSIDEDRYIWPHIMDEVSKAIPNYTWLTFLQFNGTPAATVNVVKLPPPVKPDPKGKTKPKPFPTEVPRDEIGIKIIGRTVDIQALPRFMNDLSASPFLSNVSAERADPGTEQSKELYQFTLIMNYRRPDSTFLHRLPLAITVH